MKRKILILAVILLVGAGVFWGLRQRRSRDAHEIVLYGNVDIREVNLGFRVSGKVKEVLKDEGDSVKAGEVVARLDDEPYRRQVEEAQAQVASLKAKLDLLKAGNRKEDIDKGRANVEELTATLANAIRRANRRKDLLARKAISQQDYDDAASTQDEAQAKLDAAKANLDELIAGYRKEEIAQAKADLARAEASLATARINLTDTELKAPSSGIVMTRALEPGSVVQAGPTVLTVSLYDPVWVRVYVHEPELGKVYPGMKAQIFTDSNPKKAYEGQIGYISPRAEFTPKSVETPELRTGLVYRMRVIVSNADTGLRQGMPVTVKLSTQ